ncbi:MAG: Zn-ribbon domain-containing OB-fold protein [candidate division WOR-3 bacterium]|nr:Zn-ribbon domain-containing OB-fold protein [candidate division WOR-3 bacterium]
MKSKKHQVKKPQKTEIITTATDLKPDPKLLKGIGLSDDDIKKGRVLTTHWVAEAKYKWDSGIAIGKYLEGLKQGKILGVECHKCRRKMVPPRMFCEWCFKPIDNWIELQDTGIVNTFSLCYVTWDVKRITEPQIPAVIEIDGASKGMGIMHLLGEVDPKKVYIGMKVKAVWKPEKEREGAITDIKYWKPIQ